MNGGVISDNTARGSGSGVYMVTTGIGDDGNPVPDGTFRIVTGTIYGSDAAANLRNTGGNTAALMGSAEYGTFSGTRWNSAGTISDSDTTIRVVNGALR